MQIVRLSDEIKMKRFISHSHNVEYGAGENTSGYDYILDSEYNVEKNYTKNK